MEKYQKETLLGAGQFNSRWLVKSIQTRTYYFMKEANMDLLNDYEKDKILNEIKVLSECEHKHIILYKDTLIQHAAAKLSLIMEYADGGNLSKAIVKQNGVPFSENKTLTWFIQICLALQYMHGQKILHRELQPENIFLTKNETIKVGGFASSKMLNNPEDVATATVGTLYYMSPESIKQRPYNFKHDMWALGCILFEISTLQRCFKGLHFLELVNVILDGKREEFPHWCSSLEKGIVRDLLRYDPNQRPTADEILEYPLLQPYLTKYLVQTTLESNTSEEKIRRVSSSRLLNRDSYGKRSSSESTPIAAEEFKSYKTPEVVFRSTLVAAPPIEYGHAAVKRGITSLKYSSSLREGNLKSSIKTSENGNSLKSELAIKTKFLGPTINDSVKELCTINSQPEVKSEDTHPTKDIDLKYDTKRIFCTSDKKINGSAGLSEHGNERFANETEIIAGTSIKGVHNTSLGFDTTKFETMVSSREGANNDHFNCKQSQCSQCVIDLLWKKIIRGCVETNVNRAEYLKLKDKLSLIFDKDLFQKVYQTLNFGGSGFEELFAIRNFVGTLNRKQVQHLPLMMQLIQLELLLKQ